MLVIHLSYYLLRSRCLSFSFLLSELGVTARQPVASRPLAISTNQESFEDVVVAAAVDRLDFEFSC